MTRETAFRLAFANALQWWTQIRWVHSSDSYRRGRRYVSYGGYVRRGSV